MGVVGGELAVHHVPTGVVVFLQAEQADVAADDAGRAERRHMGGQDALAELVLHVGDGAVEVGVAGVQLGQRDDPGEVGGGALLPQGLRGTVDAVRGGDHEDRGVRGPDARAQLADEVGVARGVEQVHQYVAGDQGGQVELGGALGVLLLAAVAGEAGLEQLLEQ
jgi:hypothetical protein